MPPANTPERLERLFRARTELAESGCVVWTGPLNRHGYAQVDVCRKTVLAHRAAYELWRGPIPDGLHIDHLCHTRDVECAGGTTCPHRACVNPEHLEVVTPIENSRRKATRRIECRHGHPYDEANTYWTPAGVRVCRACAVQSARRCKARKQVAA